MKVVHSTCPSIAGPPTAACGEQCSRVVRPSWCLFAALCAGACLTGCERQSEIQSYEVPKPDSVWEANHVAAKKTETSGAWRILGAIIPRGDTLWFLKAEGTSDTTAELLEPMIRVVKGLKFEGDDPKWSLPVGWTEKPGNEFRYATLVATGNREISISRLPRGEQPLPDQLLANVNRWRGQVGLPPTDAEGLKSDSVSFDLEFGDEKLPVTFVNLEGTRGSPGGMGPAGGVRPPFAGGGGAAPAPPARNVTLKHDTPTGWKVGPSNGIAALSFVVPTEAGEASQGLKITVTELPAAANDLVENVNRWRGQVGLSPASADEVKSSLTTLKVLGVDATEVVLSSPKGAPSRTIHGIIAVEGERMWFVKLDGPTPLAEREREAFRGFAQSLRKE